MPLVTGPRVDQINLVIADIDAAVRFLAELGVDVPGTTPEWEEWNPHHRSLPAAAESTFGIDIDSGAFANWWGGLPPAFTGVVIGLRVDDRSDVDRLHDLAPSVGGRSLKAPYDAFWGARYAVIEGPGPIVVGVMSPIDPAHRGAPPDLAELG